MAKWIDITNHIYGRLTVIKQFDKHRWTCICQCGNKINADKNNLRSGHTKSCGCIEKEHCFGVCGDGLRKHPLYQTWKTMIYRCTKSKRKEYKNYGGRGIKVCERWMNFQNFIDDMYPTYRLGLELDRKDNNGDYYFENCHWITGIKNKQKTSRTNLSYEKAAIIRTSDKTPLELSKIFNCSRDSIYDVLQNKTWL